MIPRWDLVVLPNLRYLECSLAVAKVLVPGRPLVELRVLDCQPDFSADLRGIFGTTPLITLTSLSIIPNMIPDTPLAYQFPQLSELRLDFPSDVHPPEMTAREKEARLTGLFDYLCKKWSYHPGMKQLKMNFGWDMTYPLSDLALQYSILTGSLLRVFPNICHLQMVEFAIWERSDTSDAWRIFIPGAHCARVIKRLSKGEPGLVDHQGYLQRLVAG
ncbi:hypothetical protein BD779DRAFT_944070 [Infundibulicybe gibba]|nr:hypothetical protein BD779DRAFT_944070 [Infundibulicybe gibba]